MSLPVVPFDTPQSLDTDPAALDLLANTELRLALRSVLARFPKLRVDGQLVRKNGLAVQALRKLPVSW